MTEAQQATASQIVPVGEIKVNIGNVELIFKPTDDITASDCTKLMVMFFNGVMAKTPVDYGAYIAQHDLAKHFMLVQQEQPTEAQPTDE